MLIGCVNWILASIILSIVMAKIYMYINEIVIISKLLIRWSIIIQYVNG